MKINDFIRRLNNLLDYPLSRGKSYAIILVAALLFFLPVLLAGTDYIDDNARAVTGYYDWGSLGRFFTELLMRLLTFSGSSMADPGRLMQILAIPTLAAAGYVFARSFVKKGDTMTIASLVLALPIVLNPFLLTNYAFRFDSLSMLLAYTSAIVGACVLGSSKTRIGVSIGLVFAAAALYQPMVMMFAVTAIVLWVYRVAQDDKSAFRKLLMSVGAFAAGTGLYFIVLKLGNFSNVGGESRGVLLTFDKQSLMQAIDNFQAGIETIRLLAVNGAGRALFVLLALTLVAGIILLIVKTKKRQRPAMAATLLASVPLLILSIMGPFIVMNSALTYQVRTLSASIGLIVLTAIISLLLYKKGSVKVAGLMLSILALCGVYALSLSYNFGGALAAQREHDVAVYDEIDDYILNEESIQKASVIYIGGLASRPDSVNDMLAKRPFLTRMEVANDNSTWYIWQRLNDSNVTKAHVSWYTQSIEQEAYRAELCKDKTSKNVFNHPYFSVYGDGSTYVVWQHDPLTGDNFCVT